MVSVISFPLAPRKSGLVSLIFPTEALPEADTSAMGSWRARCSYDPVPQMESEDGAVFAYTPQVPYGSHFSKMRVPQHVMGCCLHSDPGFARVTTPRFMGMWTLVGQVWI